MMGMLPNPSYVDGKLVCKDASKTKESFAKDADINVIVDRYLKTGALPQVTSPPVYGDISNSPTLQDSLGLIRAADAAFNALPPDVLREAKVHPKGFEGWLADPRNASIAAKHGLINLRYIPPKAALDVPLKAADGKGGGDPPVKP